MIFVSIGDINIFTRTITATSLIFTQHLKIHSMSPDYFFHLRLLAFKCNLTPAWPHQLISVGLSAAENVLTEPRGTAPVTQVNYNHRLLAGAITEMTLDPG